MFIWVTWAWSWVSVRLPVVPLVMTWKKIGTLTVSAAGAWPLADAGMSWTTWPVSFSRIVAAAVREASPGG